MSTTKRIIAPRILKYGHVEYHSVTSPPDDSVAMCHKVPDRIIPVVFVPGVMGSNLQSVVSKDGEEPEPIWITNSIGGIAWSRGLDGPKKRKKFLDPLKTEIFRKGKLPENAVPIGAFHNYPAPTQEENAAELYRRGWGEVSMMSYGKSLKWLEEALNDADYTQCGMEYSGSGLRPRLMKELVAQSDGIAPLTLDEVALSYRYQFPVHAVGYNWLDSNVVSAKRLQQKINEFIAYYQDCYRCENVILVTHSMGGLVARYYSEVLKQQSKVLGIVHGVMPATGAAAAYKRVKAGTEGSAGIVLGSNAAEVTAVFAQSPGPLQLLPSPEYGNGWLKIVDGRTFKSFPQQGDPYSEIYTVRDAWWGLVDDKLINPADTKKTSLDQDWQTFKKIINRSVRDFHENIANRYHPVTYAFYGEDAKHKTWGEAVWQRQRTTHQLRLADPASDLASFIHPAQQSSDGGGNVTVRAYSPGSPKTTQYLREANFTLGEANENGDGTVPLRSGIAPKKWTRVCVGYPDIEHEGAYKGEKQQLFTLWSIVKIAQHVSGRMRYDLDKEPPK